MLYLYFQINTSINKLIMEATQIWIALENQGKFIA